MSYKNKPVEQWTDADHEEYGQTPEYIAWSKATDERLMMRDKCGITLLDRKIAALGPGAEKLCNLRGPKPFVRPRNRILGPST